MLQGEGAGAGAGASSSPLLASISRMRRSNTCVTFESSLAEETMKGVPHSLARACPCSVVTRL